MADLKIHSGITLNLTTEEFRVIGLALHATGNDIILKDASDKALMKELNTRLLEQRVHKLREILTTAESSLGKSKE